MPASDELLELGARVRNWGRWGDDDEIGTANLIDDAAVRRGVDSVKQAHVVPLGVPLQEDGIQIGQPAGRFNPTLMFTALNERDKFAPGIWLGSDDFFSMSTCAATHIDSLSHVSYDGQLYGGRPIDSITARHGASWCGAEKIPSIVTRGILADIPKLLGVDHLDAGFAVTADHVADAIALANITVEPGDAVCVRTGEMGFYLNGDRDRYALGVDWQVTGLGLSVSEWLHENDVAACFTDNYTYEVMPPENGNWDDLLSVHMVQLRDMGLVQGQNWNFEELAKQCGEKQQYAFQLVASPEPIVGATSAPVAPIAVL